MRTLLPLLLLVLVFPLDAQQQPEFETTEIADGVYRFRFRAHVGMFVVTDDGVVAFDPINPEAAAYLAEEIRRVAPGVPLRAIVYSHRDGDHASGANVLRATFGDGVPIVAQANAAAPIREAADPNQPPPDLTFGERLTLHFGGRPIELYYLGKSHRDDMLVALLPEDRVAFAVDFVSHDGVGYRDLSSFYFPDQFTALERLRDLPFETIVFGHGPVGDKASVERQIAYYTAVRDAVGDALRRGLTEDEAAAEIQLPAYAEWRGYGDWFALNVRGIYRWLARERR